jgi:hypothetical protein
MNNDRQIPILIFLGVLLVLGLLALWGWWHGAWETLPMDRV